MYEIIRLSAKRFQNEINIMKYLNIHISFALLQFSPAPETNPEHHISKYNNLRISRYFIIFILFLDSFKKNHKIPYIYFINVIC